MTQRPRALDLEGKRPSKYSYDAETERLCRGLEAALAKVPRPNNAEANAKAAYEYLKTECAKTGQNPDYEVGISPPGSGYYPSRGGDEHVWWVTWEAGPHDWGIGGSFAAIAGTGKLCEPYYGFDLAFYTTED
jgi:hypothetical protein